MKENHHKIEAKAVSAARGHPSSQAASEPSHWLWGCPRRRGAEPPARGLHLAVLRVNGTAYSAFCPDAFSLWRLSERKCLSE